MIPTNATPATAAAELLRRLRAQRSLVDYSQAIVIPGAPASDDPDEWIFRPVESQVAVHHVAMMEAIERCIRADYGRLMIFAPPGAAKSIYVSVVGATWAMGVFPGLQVLMTSYASTPIIKQSKRARQIVTFSKATPEYKGIFSAQLAKQSTAANDWELTNGSALYAAGLMGGITSTRCGLGIIDDPVAGRAEAQSPQVRATTRAAYEDDFLTRLTPKASIILIQTRWHEDDLAGSILPEHYKGESGPVECRDGQVWEVVNLPAQCEREDDPAGRKIGEYLWPEWLPPEHWAPFRKNSRTWSALFQQRPTSEMGRMFLRNYWKRFDSTETEVILHTDMGPKRVKKDLLFIFMTADTALKAKQSNDPSVIGVWGKVPKSGELLLLHLWRDRIEAPYLEDILDAMIDVWRPRFVGIEDKASGTQLLQQFRRKGMPLRALPADVDKVSRAQPAVTMAENGMIYLPTSAPWVDDYIDELAVFNGGKYDDRVDITSYAAIAVQYSTLEEGRMVNSTNPMAGMTGSEAIQYQRRRRKRAMISV